VPDRDESDSKADFRLISDHISLLLASLIPSTIYINYDIYQLRHMSILTCVVIDIIKAPVLM